MAVSQNDDLENRVPNARSVRDSSLRPRNNCRFRRCQRRFGCWQHPPRGNTNWCVGPLLRFAHHAGDMGFDRIGPGLIGGRCEMQQVGHDLFAQHSLVIEKL